MITQEEHDRIVYDVMEKVLIRLPEVVSNLMMNSAKLFKLNKEFYEKYPDFKTDPVSVQSILKQLEEDNIGIKYEDILKMAPGKIRERMKITSALDTDSISERSNLDLNIKITDNGEF